MKDKRNKQSQIFNREFDIFFRTQNLSYALDRFVYDCMYKTTVGSSTTMTRTHKHDEWCRALRITGTFWPILRDRNGVF